MKKIIIGILILCSVAAFGQSATDYYNKGIEKSNSRDFKGSITDYSDAIKLDPNFADAYYNRGTSKVNLEDYKGSILDYDKAISLRPEYLSAYKNRGIAKLKINDLKGAQADFDAVLKIDPNNASCYYMRGQIKLQNGNSEDGCTDLQKAKELGEKRAQEYIDKYCNKNAVQNGEKANESLKLDWPDAEGWKVASNQRDDERGVVELLRNNETFDNWTEIGTMMVYPLPAATLKNVSVETAMNVMLGQSKKTCPASKLTLIEKNDTQKYPWIIFKIECPSESQVWQIIMGSNEMYANFRAIKQKTIPDDLKTKWTAFFKTAKIVTQ